MKPANYIVRNIDPELWKRVKGYASFQGITIGDVIITLLEMWVEAQAQQGAQVAPPRRGKAMAWLERPSVRQAK